jgi:L-ascorbate metabolism protein UlaG (beta-lactamase superfamily)
MKKRIPYPVFAVVVIIAAASCSSSPEPFDEGAWRAQVDSVSPETLYLPNVEDGKYFNPWLRMPDHSFGTVLRWKLFSKAKNTYTEEESAFLPPVAPDAAKRMAESAGRDYILWIGHNTFAVKIAGTIYLTDPMFSDRALLPKRKTPPAVGAEDLAALGTELVVILSHNHYDHFDKASLRDLPERTRFVAPLGLGGLVRELGKTDVIEMNWWGEIELGPGVRLISLPAQHWSRRISQGINESLWASYLLVTPKRTIYFAMDSGYFAGYREIGRRFPGIDYAVIPITAYHPRWFMHYAHMNIPEALRAFDELGARYFIPNQWGTFALGDEPPGYAYFDLKREIERQGRDPGLFLVPDIGGMIFID